MATIFNLPQPEKQPPNKRKPRQRKQPQNGVCSPCGRTECFVRPRFFSGQLLTDEDLALAQRYAIEKNKLHNRYLVGSGVVCGLAVRCHPECKGWVIVEPGYAIDCCGNDIVVCEPYAFNVREHLNKMRQKQEVICEESPDLSRQVDCTEEQQQQEYYLVIYYKEDNIKPVSALIRDNGCHVSRCEKSRTSESFLFDLLKDLESDKLSNFESKIDDCKDRDKQIQKIFGQINLDEERLNVYDIYRKLQELFSTIENFYRSNIIDVYCNLSEELRSIIEKGPKPPFPNEEESDKFLNSVKEALEKYRDFQKRLYQDCICEALLVPCNKCQGNSVVLASLILEGNKIIRICNYDRQQVISGSMLRYFLPTTKQSTIESFTSTLEASETQPFEKWIRGVQAVFSNALEDDCCNSLINNPSPNIDIERRNLPISTPLTPIARQREISINTLARDFSNNPSLYTTAVNLAQSVGDASLTILDLYGRQSIDLEEAEGEDIREGGELRALLREKNVTVANVLEIDADLARNPENFASTSWVLPQDSYVDLLVNQGRIVGARVRQGGES